VALLPFFPRLQGFVNLEFAALSHDDLDILSLLRLRGLQSERGIALFVAPQL
jgi:hypothetical protein